MFYVPVISMSTAHPFWQKKEKKRNDKEKETKRNRYM